jgi:UDP:flavonoid glycosyltransferase YjiC (YdhE family)
VVAGDSEDKPEVAARVQWSGAGIDLRSGRPSVPKLAAAVRRILHEPGFRQRARALQAEIAQTRPLDTISEVLLDLTAASTREGS